MDKIVDILAWPGAVVVIALLFFGIFRGPLSDLLRRTRRVSREGIDVGASPDLVIEQQKKIEAPANAPAISASQALPPPNEVYAAIEQELARELAASPRTPEVERAWLIREVAVQRIGRAYEVAYRLIAGSQITLMLEANTAAPPNTNRAREIYEAARTAYPTIHEHWGFDAWFQFPVGVGFLRVEHQPNGPPIVRITPMGREFLHYLVMAGLTSSKPG